eukprot:2831418-Alexandrium_andersonii.AAC.1
MGRLGWSPAHCRTKQGRSECIALIRQMAEIRARELQRRRACADQPVTDDELRAHAAAPLLPSP